MSQMIGISIGGRYHIVEQLGQGGMATVFKAHDTRLERTVAVKVIRRGAVPDEQIGAMLRRFEREAKAVAQLTHPNIVHVFDYGEHEGAPYLVMEYLPGGSLKDRIGKPVPYPEAVRLILPIARALEYAHRRETIHRDVKPANILITEHGIPMLSDFGIAKVLEATEATQLTGTGMSIGTPEYMPPEQWTGKPVYQSDIYALGVVFYELLTGRKPFIADTPAALLLKHVNDPLPRPRIFVPDIPAEVEAVLYKALAKKPEQRYANMGEFAGALETLILPGLGNGFVPRIESPPQQRAETIPQPAAAASAGKEQRRDAALEPTRLTPPQPQPIPYQPLAQRTPPAGQVSGAAEKSVVSPKVSKGWLWAGITAAIVIMMGVFIGATYLLVRGISTSQEKEPSSVALAGGQTATLTPSYTPSPTQTATPTLTITPTIAAGATAISEKDGMVLLYVPAGKFMMGSNAYEENSNADEFPKHWVILDAFWIDRTEVSNAMYALCVTDGACGEPAFSYAGSRRDYYGNPEYDQYPVVYVTWNQAKRYCEWAGRRLPTEAEWEKAARGDMNYIYPWGSSKIDCSLANTRNCVGNTAAVESYPEGAGPYGALNMAGNVAEWVADYYDEAYYSVSPEINPTGPESGAFRIIRGGAWWYLDKNARTATRLRYNPQNSGDFIGFRCAMNP